MKVSSLKVQAGFTINRTPPLPPWCVGPSMAGRTCMGWISGAQTTATATPPTAPPTLRMAAAVTATATLGTTAAHVSQEISIYWANSLNFPPSFWWSHWCRGQWQCLSFWVWLRQWSRPGSWGLWSWFSGFRCWFHDGVHWGQHLGRLSSLCLWGLCWTRIHLSLTFNSYWNRYIKHSFGFNRSSRGHTDF